MKAMVKNALVCTIIFISLVSCSRSGGSNPGGGIDIIPVTGISLNKDATTILTGNTEQLGIRISPKNAANYHVSWESADEDIATVDEYGLVLGRTPGKTEISATTEDGGKKAICIVTVAEQPVPLTSITMSEKNSTIDVNYDEQLKVTFIPPNATNQRIKWVSIDNSIASVSTTGLVTGIIEGTTTIMAISEEGGYSDKCTITVQKIQPIGITLNKSTTSLIVGNSERLTATILPDHTTNKQVNWSSSDSTIATINNDGTITGHSVGATIITAETVTGGFKSTCNVQVLPKPIPVTGVSFTSESVNLFAGQNIQLTPTITPNNATNQNCTWRTSDTKIAYVNSSGLITGINKGTAIITVTTEDGAIEATCEVNVADNGYNCGQITLVKDITVTNEAESSCPVGLVVARGYAFFWADNGIDGKSLWRTDGTEAGTVFIKAFPLKLYSQPPIIVPGVSCVYFAYDDGIHGNELWCSDGTPSGTYMIKDINTSGSSSPYSLCCVGDKVFFSADDGVHGREPWVSNGTITGTFILKDIKAGSNNAEPNYFTAYNGNCYFFINYSGSLWKSDGTVSGTVQVKSIGSYSNFEQPCVSGAYMFFSNDHEELWRTDGTSGGTVLVKKFAYSYDMTVDATSVGNTIYFPADDGVNGFELWKSNGTSAGTVMVKNINTEAYDPPTRGSSQPSQLSVLGNTVFFTANTGWDKIDTWWKSNGTTAGTIMIGVDDSNYWSGKPVVLGGALYYCTNRKIMKFTSATSTTAIDASPDCYPSELVVLGNSLIFPGWDSEHGTELFISDGTVAGTHLLKNINSTGSSRPSMIMAVVDSVYFFVEQLRTLSLWKSGGSESTTHSVVDSVFPQSNFSSFNDQDSINRYSPVTIGKTIYYIGDNPSGSLTLWKTDGTSANTSIVSSRINIPMNLSVVGSTIYFTGYSSAEGYELWVTDGTDSGTRMVKDIYPGTSSSSPSVGIKAGNILYFTASTGTSGIELWKTDGTATGTVMVKDINTGSSSSNPQYLTAVGDSLFFTANTATYGSELWKSNGTDSGTVIVSDLCAGTESTNPKCLTMSGNLLYFIGYTNGSYHICISDGTIGGTIAITNQELDSSFLSTVYPLKSVGGTLYFIINGKFGKFEGTTATILKEFKSIRNLTTVASTLYFTADDDIHGEELWKSDGTASGTVIVEDYNPGLNDSNISNITVCGSTLYFSAKSPDKGIELHKVQTY